MGLKRLFKQHYLRSRIYKSMDGAASSQVMEFKIDAVQNFMSKLFLIDTDTFLLLYSIFLKKLEARFIILNLKGVPIFTFQFVYGSYPLKRSQIITLT